MTPTPTISPITHADVKRWFLKAMDDGVTVSRITIAPSMQTMLRDAIYNAPGTRIVIEPGETAPVSHLTHLVDSCTGATIPVEVNETQPPLHVILWGTDAQGVAVCQVWVYGETQGA